MTRTIGSCIFEQVCIIQPATGSDGSIIQYAPQALYVKRPDLRLHDYGKGPFCRFRIPNDFRDEGVYALILADEVQYIGECQDLSSRYNAGYGQISPRNCYQNGQPTNCRLNNLIHQLALMNHTIELWFFKTHLRKQVEAELIRSIQPQWNRKGLHL